MSAVDRDSWNALATPAGGRYDPYLLSVGKEVDLDVCEAAVTLLRWGAKQTWGPAWRASLPVGGVDGTLKRRFGGTPLAGQVWAKTGTLNATNALSGYLRAASGRELTFAIFANDVPDGTSAVAVMDAALVLVAGAN